jgi:metallophosphoesterase (TIGR00282 family)
MPKILFLGDIVGRPGRTMVIERLAGIREEIGADVVIANAENAAGGAGLTKKLAEALKTAGVDAITLGDHVWDQKNFENEIDELDWVCRPANLPDNNPGRSHLIVECGGFRLGIFTVLGRNYIGLKSSCPFQMADSKIEALAGECDGFFVEAHMEATSEKIALGWHLEGRAVAVVGTHTHVPTADGRILPGGTAYLSDAGMCGPYESVLGRARGEVIATFLDGMKRRFPVADGDVRIAGCLIELDPVSRHAVDFRRIEIKNS